MIYPTIPTEVWKKAGTDAYAQPKWQKMPGERVAPVRLSFQTDNTTVRTDSAGTKGHAQEFNAQTTVLALPKTKIDIGDKLVIMGYSLRVVEKHPRFTVGGTLDHFQVHCAAWT
jgi:hypothetical protein